jgi:hypothetical protein
MLATRRSRSTGGLVSTRERSLASSRSSLHRWRATICMVLPVLDLKYLACSHLFDIACDVPTLHVVDLHVDLHVAVKSTFC